MDMVKACEPVLEGKKKDHDGKLTASIPDLYQFAASACDIGLET